MKLFLTEIDVNKHLNNNKLNNFSFKSVKSDFYKKKYNKCNKNVWKLYKILKGLYEQLQLNYTFWKQSER